MAHQPTARHHLRKERRKRDACNAYVAPAADATVKAFQPTDLQWNPDCFSSYDSLDIYLYSVNTAQDIHIWKGVPKTPPTLNTTFNPTWRSLTNGSTPMQLIIAGADQPSWAASAPGPTFSATFDGNVPDAVQTSATPSSTAGPSVDDLSGAKEPDSGVTGGKLVAAIVVPIVAAIVGIAGYIWWSRRKTGQASKRWSAYVDQRMSVVSAGWQPSIGHARNASNASFASNRAGLGAAPRAPEMAQTRQPRISFASDTRASQPRLSQLHLPNRRPEADFALSPGQEDGPRVLDDHSAMLGAHQAQKPSLGGRSLSNLRFELGSNPDTSAAVTMSTIISDDQARPMSGADSSANGSLGHGSAAGMRRLSNVRTSTLSPDEALRQYTLTRKSTPSSPPASERGMRVLYSPSLSPPKVRPSVYSEGSRYSSASSNEGIDDDAPGQAR